MTRILCAIVLTAALWLLGGTTDDIEQSEGY